MDIVAKIRALGEGFLAASTDKSSGSVGEIRMSLCSERSVSKVGLERRVHQLRNGPCHIRQALLSCVEVESSFLFFLICLRVCGSPGKTRVPHCEEWPGAAHFRRDQKCEQPDYEQCILVSMKPSLKNKTLASSALAVFSSLIIDGSAQLEYEKCISMLDISPTL